MYLFVCINKSLIINDGSLDLIAETFDISNFSYLVIYLLYDVYLTPYIHKYVQ